MEKKRIILSAIDARAETLCALSDAIWDHPELGYQEFFSSGALSEFLEEEGFLVTRNLADIPTAFSASYGRGAPVIGLLGEFDALSNLSQEAGVVQKQPTVPGGAGHGCGHNLLGVGAAAAAIAVKEYLKETGNSGTVIYFGCPAEEGGAGKGFMARSGVFDGLDAALSWHPSDCNCVQNGSTIANYQVRYRFHGVAAHAAIAPELGRSALDAAELMNIGVQFLREHVRPEVRIHYAVTNAGGSAPGVVQSEAELLYLMRAPDIYQVRDVYERVNKIAQGAALMTETQLEVQFVKACSNLLCNRVLMEVLQKNFELVGPTAYTEEEFAQARAFQDTMEYKDEHFLRLAQGILDLEQRRKVLEELQAPLHGVVLPLAAQERMSMASSDVGDVSWICPTAQISVTTVPDGTPMHSWQEVAVGKSSFAKKGMLHAGKVLACAMVDLLQDEGILRRAREELNVRTQGKPYCSPIPKDVALPVLA